MCKLQYDYKLKNEGLNMFEKETLEALTGLKDLIYSMLETQKKQNEAISILYDRLHIAEQLIIELTSKNEEQK